MTPEQEEHLLDALLTIRAVLARLETLMEKIALGLGIPPHG